MPGSTRINPSSPRTTIEFVQTHSLCRTQQQSPTSVSIGSPWCSWPSPLLSVGRGRDCGQTPNSSEDWPRLQKPGVAALAKRQVGPKLLELAVGQHAALAQVRQLAEPRGVVRG